MTEINYSPFFDKKGDVIPKEIYELILNKDPHFDAIKYGKFKIRNVQSPFILADNSFDLQEANNKCYEIGVKRTKSVEFTGGAMYTEFAKDGEGIIVHGNDNEGYNIFILQ